MSRVKRRSSVHVVFAVGIERHNNDGSPRLRDGGVIVWLDNRPGGALPELVERFRRGLAEVGFSEGRDVTVEYGTP